MEISFRSLVLSTDRIIVIRNVTIISRQLYVEDFKTFHTYRWNYHSFAMAFIGDVKNWTIFYGSIKLSIVVFYNVDRKLNIEVCKAK